MKNGRQGVVALSSAVAGLALFVIPGCGGSSQKAPDGGGAAGGSASGAGGANQNGVQAGAGGALAGAASGGTSGAMGLSGTAGTLATGGNAGTGDSGHAGRSGAGGGGTTGSNALGLDCSADIDCGPALKCVLPDDATLTSGGPAHGLCTLACIGSLDCNAVLPGAGCVDFGGGAAYCLESCTPGEPADISTKCHGRVDMACAGFTSSVAVCWPLCRADVECGTGRFCDPRSGLCVAAKPTGDPVGTPCNPAATTTSCLGTCLITSAVGVTPATGQCAQLCSGGSECMYTGTQPGGICVGPLSDTFGSLDLGYCEPSCNCTHDCKLPGDVCQAWLSTESAFKADLGSDGFCYPNAIGSTELTCQ